MRVEETAACSASDEFMVFMVQNEIKLLCEMRYEIGTVYLLERNII